MLQNKIIMFLKSDWQFPTNHMQTPSKSQIIYLHFALERQVGTLHSIAYDINLYYLLYFNTIFRLYFAYLYFSDWTAR